jgi:hypothetical protein
MSDYYGDKYKWFIGRVVDTNDDMNANRVKVSVFGIHPTDPIATSSIDYIPETQSQSGTTSLPRATAATLTPIDENNLPGVNEFGAKISRHFTLGNLTIDSLVSGNRCRQNKHLITKDIVANLSNLAVNCLDVIAEEYGKFTVNSGWRTPVPGDMNHQYGYAVDIVPHRGSHTDLALFIKNNLYGRYSFLIHEYSATTSSTWCHVQLGSSGRRNQGTTDRPLIQTYLGGQYVSGIVQRSA